MSWYVMQSTKNKFTQRMDREIRESRSPSFGKTQPTADNKVFPEKKEGISSSFPKTTVSTRWGSTRPNTEMKAQSWGQSTISSSAKPLKWGSQPPWRSNVKDSNPKPDSKSPWKQTSSGWREPGQESAKAEQEKKQITQIKWKSGGAWNAGPSWRKEKQKEEEEKKQTEVSKPRWGATGSTNVWNSRQAKSWPSNTQISSQKEESEISKSQSIWSKKRPQFVNTGVQKKEGNIFEQKPAQSESRYALRSRDKAQSEAEQKPKSVVWKVPMNKKPLNESTEPQKIDQKPADFAKRVEQLQPIKEVDQAEKKSFTPLKLNKVKSQSYLKDVSFSDEAVVQIQQPEPSPRFRDEPEREEPSSPQFGKEEKKESKIQQPNIQEEPIRKIIAPTKVKSEARKIEVGRLVNWQPIDQSIQLDFFSSNSFETHRQSVISHLLQDVKGSSEVQRQSKLEIQNWLRGTVESKKKELFKRNGIKKIRMKKHVIASQDIQIPITELINKPSLTLLNTATGPCYNTESVLKYHPIKQLQSSRKSGYSSYSRRDPVQTHKLKQRQLILGKLAMFSHYDESTPTLEIRVESREGNGEEDDEFRVREIKADEMNNVEKVAKIKTIDDTMGLLVTEQLKNFSQQKILQQIKEKLRRDKTKSTSGEECMKGVVARLLGN